MSAIAGQIGIEAEERHGSSELFGSYNCKASIQERTETVVDKLIAVFGYLASAWR